MPRYYHITPHARLKKILATGLVPDIGPRSRKIGEKEAAVYLFSSAHHLMDACLGWLPDTFGEEARLALLAVDLDNEAAPNPAFEAEVQYREPIPTSVLSVLSRDIFAETVAQLEEILTISEQENSPIEETALFPTP